MTNQEKQQNKPLANTLPSENGRINIKGGQEKLSPDEEIAIKNFQTILDQKFRDIMDTGNFTPNDMVELLYPFLNAPNIVSKICAPPGCIIADRRHVSLKLMAAMRRVFGISIDELLDECFQSLPDRKQPIK